MNKSTTPRRVLHIVSAMKRGGAETLLMNVHRNLDRSKIQFDYVSHLDEKCDYDDEINLLGGRVFRIKSLGQLGPLGYINELKRIMLQTNYTAVHAHTDYQTGFAAFAAKRAGIHKRICHSHSNNWGKGSGFKGKIVLKTLQALIKYAATDYCACSKDAARFLFGESWIEKNKFLLLKNGIDISQFTKSTSDNSNIRQELDIASDTKILGHVGRFSQSKNQKFLLMILKQMLDDGKDVMAILVGDGPCLQDVKDEARRLGIFEHIRFVGVRQDIPSLMRTFDVFLFPSLFEGFGIVALEAQASGTPCIASDVVSRSTDLGLGLISFISLEEHIEIWIKEIEKSFMQIRPDDQQIMSNFSKSGYDIQQNIEEWMSVYGVI
ncbi:glycosyltransferase [Paenibacillus sp. 5J-6]|uniref:Glycosyltransferase n=1 Tax=Paenibacillus silvestris TaxID=2606219 RepID=A0A6L8UZK6_9BACL|nr:glycosyltransferase family 1 protein [Paenibacillus silvestris]MZQ83643.1 glycosyltransferase [Paenibacillus silvestris]